MSDIIKTKQCSKCKGIKAVSEFYKNKSRHNGLSGHCKNCVKQYNQTDKGKQRSKRYCHSEKGKQAHKRYDQAEKGKQARKRYKQTEKGKQAYKRYGKNNPEKKKARCKISDAIRAGKLLPAYHYWCACGKQAEQYHHHLGYEPEHQFDVIPVCVKCHKSVHLIY